MYWNKKGNYQSMYNTYVPKLVPQRGVAATPHGELLRVMTNIIYRFNNDGDDTWFALVQMGACDEGYTPPYDAPADVRDFFRYIPEECKAYNKQLWAYDNKSDDDDDAEFDPDVKRFDAQELETIMDLILLYVHKKETMM